MRSRQSMSRKRSGRTRRRTSTSSKRSRAKKRPSGVWIVLVVILLIFGGWELTQVSPGLLILGSIVGIVIVLLLFGAWLALRRRPTAEEQERHIAHQLEHVQMQDTAQALRIRPIELQDLAHMGDTEFEHFTGALLEAMGVASDLERVGGAGDRGIDLRGKNRYGLLLIVQCKRYFGGKIPPRQTREFGGTMGLHGAREAWFVTTSFFTDQAKTDVQHLTLPGHMVLVDGDLLITFIREHWDALSHRWQWRLTECMVVSDRRRGAE